MKLHTSAIQPAKFTFPDHLLHQAEKIDIIIPVQNPEGMVWR
jgi:hypothetical protein